MTKDRSHTRNVHTPHEEPLQPEIPRSKFARGMLRQDRDEFALRLGGFADGQRVTPTPAPGPHRGRFSEGQEVIGDGDPERHIRRRFSEGLESEHSA